MFNGSKYQVGKKLVMGAVLALFAQVSQALTLTIGNTLTISNAADSNITRISPFTPTASSANISWATINNALASGNIELNTVDSKGNGDVTIGQRGTISNGNEFTINAGGNIYQNSSLTNINGRVTYSAANNIYLYAGISADNLSLTATNNIYLAGVTLTASNINVGGGNLNGTGVIDGNLNVSNLGAVTGGQVGSTGLLTVQKNLSFDQVSALNINIGGTTRGSGYGALNVGSATLSGKLSISLLDFGSGLFAPKAGDTFDILNVQSGNITGDFTQLNLPTLSDGLLWSNNIISLGGGVSSYRLSITAVPEPESYVMMIAGLGLVGFSVRRKNQTA